jgi:hypothetical protein
MTHVIAISRLDPGVEHHHDCSPREDRLIEIRVSARRIGALR